MNVSSICHKSRGRGLRLRPPFLAPGGGCCGGAVREWEGSFLLGQLRTFPAPPLKDTSSEKPSLLHSPLSPVYLSPWAALIRALSTECPCVCVSVCLSLYLSVCGRGLPWERAGTRDPRVPRVAQQTPHDCRNVGRRRHCITERRPGWWSGGGQGWSSTASLGQSPR